MAKMINKGRSIPMLPNVQLHIFILEILLFLFCNDHYLAIRNRWQVHFAYIGESTDVVKEKMYFILAFLSLVFN